MDHRRAAIALAVVAGILVTRSVVKPLRTIETSLSRVATGEAGRLDHTSNDLEVGSLTDAINRTLTELAERRRRSRARRDWWRWAPCSPASPMN